LLPEGRCEHWDEPTQIAVEQDTFLPDAGGLAVPS
jgi:hypothetical protein